LQARVKARDWRAFSLMVTLRHRVADNVIAESNESNFVVNVLRHCKPRAVTHVLSREQQLLDEHQESAKSLNCFVK
jgi:hypothetical protein